MKQLLKPAENQWWINLKVECPKCSAVWILDNTLRPRPAGPVYALDCPGCRSAIPIERARPTATMATAEEIARANALAETSAPAPFPAAPVAAPAVTPKPAPGPSTVAPSPVAVPASTSSGPSVVAKAAVAAK